MVNIDMYHQMEEAEQQAQKRDLANLDQSELTDEDIRKIKEVEEKADSLGLHVVRKRVKNQALFTQSIKENIDYLVRKKTLTMNEFGFLTAIQPLLEYQVNAIYDNETNSFMTISGISEYVGQGRSTVSRMVSSLLSKGVLFEFGNSLDKELFNRNVTARTIFVNPELFYCGDRNQIDATLATLVMQSDRFERTDIKLPWKVYRKSGEHFGRLYRRKTYLELKKKDRAKR